MKNEPSMEEENARLRGDLLTVATRVSHDLRTPLGGMVTAAEVLRESCADKQSVQLTQAILDSVDDMGRLIKQISFITRATANPLPLQRANMGDIVNAALQRMERRISKKNASLVAPPDWPQVNGAPEWLETVWSNLLANALQHTGGNPRIELSWRREEGWLRFGITDNGGGVPEQYRSGLFHPFHLLHRPDATRGLGLSIVQRLMELQGGKCGYEPLPGGSFFFFSLPGD